MRLFAALVGKILLNDLCVMTQTIKGVEKKQNKQILYLKVACGIKWDQLSMAAEVVIFLT